ncbi:MAG TPA: carbohydrate ABC transporter permease [Acidimicrobiales bacterium]|nr:carbohydrate ABC transporter permease [Acidimicrobiales bacterium]
MAAGGRPSRRRRLGTWAVGALILTWTVVPVYWALVVSLMTPVGLDSIPPSVLPRPFTLQYYQALLGGKSAVSTVFLEALRNSAVEATGTTVFTVAVALVAAYAFARLRFPGGNILFLAILGTLALPVYAVLIPLFQLATRLQQVDTYQAVILINSSASLPLAVWLLRSHIASLPVDLENAARVDGAGSLTILRRITAPLIAPGVAATGVFVFLTTWATFLIPLTFAPTLRTEPLTVLIPQYTSRYAQDYGLQAAAGLIALLPPALIVAWLNRHLLSGLLAGSGSH